MFRQHLYCSIVLLAYFALVSCHPHQKRDSQKNMPTTTTIHPQDSLVLEKFFAFAQNKQLNLIPLNQRIATIGTFFINTPYKGGTLDENPQETLIINLRAMDCVTFVDNVLALALLTQYDNNQIPHFLSNLQRIRYRNGQITDYTARLHYSTDWLHEMTNLGILSDISQAAGGVPFPNHIHFISTHHHLYHALQQDSSLIMRMQQIEKEINKRRQYYLPKNRVNLTPGQLQTGDIILITTNKKGLDTAHVGIAIEQHNTIYLLHASIIAGKVTISSSSLQEYLQKINSHTGIIIGRSSI